MRELLAKLNGNQIQARPFWVPMNQLPPNKDNVYFQHKDVAGTIYKECISIPSSVGLTDDQLASVVETIKSIY